MMKMPKTAPLSILAVKVKALRIIGNAVKVDTRAAQGI